MTGIKDEMILGKNEINEGYANYVTRMRVGGKDGKSNLL